MTEQDKQLLLADLCARLPYGVICDRLGNPKKLLSIAPNAVFSLQLDNGEYAAPCYTIEEAKPYLRTMSSMTEDERKEYAKLLFADLGGVNEDFHKALDYLHKKHINYRLPPHLFIEITEENNPYE